MRAGLALAIAVALTACAPQGPNQAQFNTAIADYFAPPQTYPVDIAGAELRGSALVSFSDCSAMGPTWTCNAVFDQRGKQVRTRVTIVERDKAWFVESVHPL